MVIGGYIHMIGHCNCRFKRLISTLLTIAVTLGIFLFPAQGAGIGSAVCGSASFGRLLGNNSNIVNAATSDPILTISPAHNDSMFVYLDEIYVEKYPELGLEFSYGSEQDRQALLQIAQTITVGLQSDRDKALAIAQWTKENLRYVSYRDGAPLFPIDVFRERSGNCVGQAEFLCQTLRLLGIPSVVLAGSRKDLASTPISQMGMNHSWSLIRYDGQWHLFDPLFGVYDLTDRTQIDAYYCPYEVEGVMVFPDPTRTFGDYGIIYVDGRFMMYYGGQPTGMDINGYRWDDVIPFVCKTYTAAVFGQELCDYNYADDPSRRSQMIHAECFTNGWVTDKEGNLYYADPNGVMASGRFLQRDGQTLYASLEGECFIMEGSSADYRLTNCLLTVGRGGSFHVPMTHELAADAAEGYGISYSINPNVSAPGCTIDQNGILHAGDSTGEVLVNISSDNGGHVCSLRLYVADSLEVSYDFTDHGRSVNPTMMPDTPAPTASPSPTNLPSVSSSPSGINGFVERLYTVALGRSSDPAGAQAWADTVTSGQNTGADLARGFLYSPEFLNKNCSNEEFVRTLYLTFFDREADEGGLSAWVGVLDGGEPRENVIEGFINSTEWANLCLVYGIRSGGTGVPSVEVEPNQATVDFATRLYTTCLGRDADQAGLMAWARQLANQRDTGSGAARGFFFSSEFLGQNVSNGEYVTRLYRTFMGREPDQAGFYAWVGQLSGGVSREEVFDGFAASPEFTRICAEYGIVRG